MDIQADPPQVIECIDEIVWKKLGGLGGLPDDARAIVQHAIEKYVVASFLTSKINRKRFLERVTSIRGRTVKLMKDLGYLRSLPAFGILARAYMEGLPRDVGWNALLMKMLLRHFDPDAPLSPKTGAGVRAVAEKLRQAKLAQRDDGPNPARCVRDAAAVLRNLQTNLAEVEGKLETMKLIGRRKPGQKPEPFTVLINTINGILIYYKRPQLKGSNRTASNNFAFEVCKLADPTIKWTRLKNAIKNKLWKDDKSLQQMQENIEMLEVMHRFKYDEGQPKYYVTVDAIVPVSPVKP